MLVRATVADETPPTPFTIGVTDWLPLTMEHGPAALKLTCSPFGELLVSAVALTGRVEVEIDAELGNWLRTMVWLSVSTAGVDGALERGAGFVGSGTTVVAIV